jgi:hypothetical protein
MKGVLDVYLGRRLAGRLTQDEHGLTTFGYWCSHGLLVQVRRYPCCARTPMEIPAASERADVVLTLRVR